MALVKLDFQPGINKENTSYSTEGGWEDSDKIRFRAGKPEKIGGWDKYLNIAAVGVARKLHIWRTLDGTIYLAIGTNEKFYVETGGQLIDVTPIRQTHVSTATDNCIQTDGSTTTVIVNITSHSCEDGAYVTISGVSGTVGGVPASEINVEHKITYLTDDSFSITVSTASTSAVAAGGGTAIEVECQINPGRVSGLYQYGFGAGTWGLSTWGTARTSGSAINLEPALWSVANWGEDLIINRRGDAVWIWDATDPLARATQITQAPHAVNSIVVTQDRHLVCFGCNAPATGVASDPLDTMHIRWCSQEDYTDWTPTATNTAGDQLLTGGTKIVGASTTEGQTAIWTDDDMHSMQFIGPPYTFGFQQIGSSTGLIGPNAWVSYNNALFWMGENSFYTYQGGVQAMPCSVHKYVFDSITDVHKSKVFATLDRDNHEITWYYPADSIETTNLNGAISDSATTISVDTTAGFLYEGTLLIGTEYISYTGKTDASFTGCTRGARGSTAVAHDTEATVTPDAGEWSTEPYHYVTYSILEKIWWVGRLERTAWVDKGALKYPIACSTNGYLYQHESGVDADGEPLVARIESSDFDLGEGDNMMFIHRVIPDFTLTGVVHLNLNTRYYPLSPQVKETITQVTTSTTKIDTRIRGRQMSLAIKSDDVGADWKYGSTRINQRPDGRR